MPFEEKMKILTEELSKQFEESRKLDEEIINKKIKGKIYTITAITLGIIAIIIAIWLGYLLIKIQISIESISSLLLAFFSIFISIFFYFKADESNTKFYNSSYFFMKDVSVILGRIEERFGEKLNNMSEKLNNIKDKKRELTNVEEDRAKMIYDLIEKTNLNNEEKEKYKQLFEEKEEESKVLKRDLYYLEMRNNRIKNELKNHKENYRKEKQELRDIMKSL